MAEKKNIHEGHRQRLLNTILEAGLGKVSDVVALEYILTYVIPRADTNELAHRILSRFGTAADALNADWEMLADIEGMGETSAKKFHLLTEVFEYYTDQMLSKKYSFASRSDVADFFEELLRFKSVEMTYIVGIDAKNRIKSRQRLSTGGMLSVGISTHQIAKFVTGTRPTFVFLAHNHPSGAALPSDADVAGTKIIENLLKTLGVPLVDHIIVGADGVYSMTHQMYFREFKNYE